MVLTSVKLIECMQLAYSNGYCILQLNDYAAGDNNGKFAKFETIVRLITLDKRFQEFADMEWDYKTGSGMISTDCKRFKFYLWSAFPECAAQFAY
jgi:hypothetical protein